jgi:hypothetical protein
MKYSTPELVVLGPASVLVLGPEIGRGDNLVSPKSQEDAGVAMGLDD